MAANPEKVYAVTSLAVGAVDPNPAGSIDIPGPFDDVVRAGRRALGNLAEGLLPQADDATRLARAGEASAPVAHDANAGAGTLFDGIVEAGKSLVKRKGTVTLLGKAHGKETAFANELAARGHDVVVRGVTAAGADLLIDGAKWELKTLEAGTVNAVRQNLRKGLKQGEGRVIIDGRAAGLSHGNAIRAVQQHERAGRMAEAIEVRILTMTGEYVWTP